MTIAVQVDRAQEITALHHEIANHLHTSLEKAIRIGELLCDQKASLKHGEFGDWIAANLPFTDRSARNYMRLYENRELLKTETFSDLSLTQGYRLLSTGRDSAFNNALDMILLALAQQRAVYKEFQTAEQLLDSAFALATSSISATFDNAFAAMQPWKDEAARILANPSVTVKQVKGIWDQAKELEEVWAEYNLRGEMILGRILIILKDHEKEQPNDEQRHTETRPQIMAGRGIT